jgi:RNA polymerase sigma-70 factor (ECF subfamily)
VPGPGIDSPAALDYIVPARAAAVDSREFDYDVLVRPVEGRMMRSIWRIVREREAAEDALQEALAVIWKKRNAVARHPKPEALILRIAVSAAYDAVRKRRRRLRHEVPGLPDGPADDAAPPVTKGIEDRELRTAILCAIGRLPRRQATAVLLHIVEEQSYEDIARAMGCSESTVRAHVMRGRAALTRLLARELPGLAGGRERIGKKEVAL